jgi:hypothetical protein
VRVLYGYTWFAPVNTTMNRKVPRKTGGSVDEVSDCQPFKDSVPRNQMLRQVTSSVRSEIFDNGEDLYYGLLSCDTV